MGLTSSAEAADEPDRPLEAAPRQRDVSLTLDPTRPLLGTAIVNGEVRITRTTVFPGQPARDVSVAGWLGVGRLRVADDGLFGGARPAWSDCDDSFYCDRGTLVWVGAQALVYAVGTFEHGLQIGTELSYAHVWGERRYNESWKEMSAFFNDGTVSPGLADEHVSGGALVPGVVIGYKLVTKPGLTLNPQLAGDVQISREGISKVYPRLALNAGWSF